MLSATGRSIAERCRSQVYVTRDHMATQCNVTLPTGKSRTHKRWRRDTAARCGTADPTAAFTPPSTPSVHRCDLNNFALYSSSFDECVAAAIDAPPPAAADTAAASSSAATSLPAGAAPARLPSAAVGD